MKKNRISKKKTSSTLDLLQKYEEVEQPMSSVGTLAAEVAAVAAARSEKIRRKVLGNFTEREIKSDEEEEAEGAAEMKQWFLKHSTDQGKEDMTLEKTEEISNSGPYSSQLSRQQFEGRNDSPPHLELQEQDNDYYDHIT